MHPVRILFALVSLPALAGAQSFNIDLGMGAAPSAGYPAAAGQAGLWVAANPTAGFDALPDINGTPSSLHLNIGGSLGFGGFDAPATSGAAWPGAHVAGVTYTRHTGYVPDTTVLVASSVSGEAVINGIQFVRRAPIGVSTCTSTLNSTANPSSISAYGSASVQAAVWDALQDVEAHPMTGKMAKSVERLPDQDGRAAWTEDMGRGEIITVTTSASEAPRHLQREMSSATVNMTSRWDYSLEEDGAGCRVKLSAVTDIERGTWHTPIFRVMMFLGGGVKKGLGIQLAAVATTLNR